MIKNILKKFTIITAIAILCFAGFFFWINFQVQETLELHQKGAKSAIYSEYYIIQSGREVTESVLRQVLANRKYIETSSQPNRPGEYRILRDSVEIRVRQFRLPSGEEEKERTVFYNLSDFLIRNSKSISIPDLTLEPVPLEVLGKNANRKQTSIPLKKMPPHIKNAVLAIEDSRFFDHYGIDLKGISRALVANIKARDIVQGGSTITQQLAKNIFLSPERSLKRKVIEVFAAFSLELNLSKEEILELYLNEVYLGQKGSTAIHGFPEASHFFFGKEIQKLTLPEAALLAGIIKGPSYYSPERHYPRASRRKELVLGKMAELSFITEKEKLSAAEQKPALIKARQYQRKAPHFIEALKKELNQYVEFSSAYRSGIQVHTGISYELQQCAQTAVEQGLDSLEKNYSWIRNKKSIQAGLVAIEPFSGEVKAWIGGRNYSKNQFDHVSQAERQIGSTIKPFVYLAALDKTLNSYKTATPVTILPDEPISIKLPSGKTWSPENFDHKFRGKVTLRYALEKSINLPAVHIVKRIGINPVNKVIKNFGIHSDPPEVFSVALGAIETNLLRMTSAYAALANGGTYITPRMFISALMEEQSPVLPGFKQTPLADENAVYVLNNILQGVVERGTARRIRSSGYKFPAAGKTGTSNESRDTWFIGFSPELAAGVWVGFDNNDSTKLTGSSAALPLWINFMKCAAPYVRQDEFLPPAGVHYLKIDNTTRELATENCPSSSVITEVFVKSTEPLPCLKHSGQRSIQKQPEPRMEREPLRKKRTKGLWEILFGD